MDDTCLLNWKKNILTFLEKTSFLVITVKLMHLAVEQTNFHTACLRMMAETASDGYLYLYILHHTLSGVSNKSLVILSLHQKNRLISRGFCTRHVYRERINVPELSILALFTGADMEPSDRAFTSVRPIRSALLPQASTWMHSPFPHLAVRQRQRSWRKECVDTQSAACLRLDLQVGWSRQLGRRRCTLA